MVQAQDSGYVGRSIPRREDRRLLTGRGQFVADLKFPDTLHAVFVRSQVAHAHIRSVDLSRAAAAPGVAYVLSGAELVKLLPPVPDTQLSLPRKWTTQVQHTFLNPQQPLLAHDKVRHVGEAVAVILAESRYLAEDAAELVTLDLEPLPAIVDPEAALSPGSPVLHDKYGTNLIGEFRVGKGDVEKALARAPHRLKRRFHHHRYAAIPMECRGIVSVYDQRSDTITIWSSSHVVHWVRREASTVLTGFMRFHSFGSICAPPNGGASFLEHLLWLEAATPKRLVYEIRHAARLAHNSANAALPARVFYRHSTSTLFWSRKSFANSAIFSSRNC